VQKCVFLHFHFLQLVLFWYFRTKNNQTVIKIFQLWDSPYGEVLATQLTAVAAKDNVSAVVEVKTRLDHLVNQKKFVLL
jgi:hypothetical protein